VLEHQEEIDRTLVHLRGKRNRDLALVGNLDAHRTRQEHSADRLDTLRHAIELDGAQLQDRLSLSARGDHPRRERESVTDQIEQFLARLGPEPEYVGLEVRERGERTVEKATEELVGQSIEALVEGDAVLRRLRESLGKAVDAHIRRGQIGAVGRNGERSG